MGFFGKIGQVFGIGGVKIKCTCPTPTFTRTGGTIAGSTQFISKNDQLITRLTAKVVEVITTKEGNETKEKDFDLGTTLLGTDIALKAGETKTMEFQVTYTGGTSITDKMQAKGGVLGAMGKLSAMAGHEKSEFRLRVDAAVKGSMVGSKDYVRLNPV